MYTEETKLISTWYRRRLIQFAVEGFCASYFKKSNLAVCALLDLNLRNSRNSSYTLLAFLQYCIQSNVFLIYQCTTVCNKFHVRFTVEQYQTNTESLKKIKIGRTPLLDKLNE